MGSGNKRKTNDRVRINVPASADSTGGGVASGGSDQVDINQACPLAFIVKLQQQVDNGLKATISGNDILSGEKVIGKLSSARSKQISFCAENGIQYVGKTESDKNGRSQVRFQQVQ